ncbi:TetR/AcrR family transcriptional regulator [Arthrobacter livingstonensis]|uniref:TetR/AcrR family transcriptional regulator n=1 Tax=Arthrobacter livingstonensis TaxID=670078 RepID=A0A2V5L3A0_9MICC|nr:TetR/AcrR family transcriptional regulator [Arthrobacter livingstonensis]PYI64584.1 TetR/AcrR family transcriptional regulator [Arthrobacter livingstonensis]
MTQTPTRRTDPPTSGRRNNPRGEGARLREELIDAACALLAETGSASRLSIRAVAARTGVAATSVYLHFADLDEIKLAVADRAFADLGAARTAATAGIDDPAAELTARCLAYVDFALTHPGQYRLMFGADLPADLFTRSYESAASPIRTAYESLIDAIRRCQRTGATHDDTDPNRLGALLWPALHGQITLRLDRPHLPRPPLHELVTETVQRLIGLHYGDSTPRP